MPDIEMFVSDDPDWNHPDAWLIHDVTTVGQSLPDGRREVFSLIELHQGAGTGTEKMKVEWPEDGSLPPGLQSVMRAWLEQIPVRLRQRQPVAPGA